MRSLLILALTLAAAPAARAPAQTSAEAPAGEAARLESRLAALQQQALQSPEVAAARARFEEQLTAAMIGMDPAARERVARAGALTAEVEAARTAGDLARLNRLAVEASALQSYFAELRPRAIAMEEVQRARTAFLTALHARMRQIDPRTDDLQARLLRLRAGGSR